MTGRDQVAQQRLRLLIGDGDRAAITLAVHDQPAVAEVSEGQVPGLPGDVDGELHQVLHGRHRSRPATVVR